MKTLFPQKSLRELHRSSSHSRATVYKPLIAENCAEMRKKDGVMIIKPDV
jgi:hypothetical protein